MQNKPFIALLSYNEEDVENILKEAEESGLERGLRIGTGFDFTTKLNGILNNLSNRGYHAVGMIFNKEKEIEFVFKRSSDQKKKLVEAPVLTEKYKI